MDVLSTVANGFAVVAFAVQLSESCIKLYKFWEAVEDAPQDIKAIKEDLQYLISVFKQIEPVKTPLGECITEGMKHVWVKVLELNAIIEKFDEGFQSSSRRRQIWTAFKATSQTKQVQKFRDSLSEAKSTLTLAFVHQCVVQSQLHSYKISTGGILLENSQHHPLRAESDLHLLTERSVHGKIIPQTASPKHAGPVIVHHNMIQETRTARAVLTHFEKTASQRAMGEMKLPELMLHAVERIGASRFESNSLEIFAQDGYTMDRNGTILAKTFVYSDNLQYRVSHRTTSFRTAFGCLWVRRTTRHISGKACESEETTEHVTSYMLYPNAWIQRFGVRNGLEANIAFAGQNTLLSCTLKVNCAVPEDSLIFELCRTGQTRAVEILLSKKLGSVVDTSPRGWKPLHFAAAGGHVDLCAMLIQKGADKSALVFEGPTTAILSPITLFVASAHNVHAEVKISMLRLFSDCIELTDQKSDGWTVLEWLKRTYAIENVPVSQNSITWMHRCTANEEYIELTSDTFWCGLQHAIRTVLCHTRHGRFLDRILELSNGESQAVSRKRVDDLAILLALRACGKALFPLVISAGSFAQVSGFDWAYHDLNHREYLKALPTMYTAWCNMILDYTDNLESYLRVELDYYQQQLGIARAEILEAVSQQRTMRGCDDTQVNCQTCTYCGKDFSPLPSALVSPIRIAATECIQTNHMFGCVCEKAHMLHPASGQPELPDYTGTYCLGSNHEVMDSLIEDEFYDAEPYPLSDDIHADQDSSATSLLSEVAILLYRSQGRTWIGDYATDELLCASCFLAREHYIDKDGFIADFSPKPHNFDGLRFKS